MPPSDKSPQIEVLVLSDSKTITCEANCGVDWSSPDVIALVRERLKERFGDRVRLEYLDFSRDADRKRALEIDRRYTEISLPALVINGEPRVSGRFDVRILLDAVDAVAEISL